VVTTVLGIKESMECRGQYHPTLTEHSNSILQFVQDTTRIAWAEPTFNSLYNNPTFLRQASSSVDDQLVFGLM